MQHPATGFYGTLVSPTVRRLQDEGSIPSGSIKSPLTGLLGRPVVSKERVSVLPGSKNRVVTEKDPA